MTQAYKMVIEHDAQEGYVATFPELADCQARAESLKALMMQIRVALAHHSERREPVAEPRPANPPREPDIAEDAGQHYIGSCTRGSLG